MYLAVRAVMWSASGVARDSCTPAGQLGHPQLDNSTRL